MVILIEFEIKNEWPINRQKRIHFSFEMSFHPRIEIVSALRKLNKFIGHLLFSFIVQFRTFDLTLVESNTHSVSKRLRI